MKPLNLLSIALVAALLSACGENNVSDAEQLGANPTLPEAQRGLVPTLKIAKPAGWVMIIGLSYRQATKSKPLPLICRFRGRR